MEIVYVLILICRVEYSNKKGFRSQWVGVNWLYYVVCFQYLFIVVNLLDAYNVLAPPI